MKPVIKSQNLPFPKGGEIIFTQHQFELLCRVNKSDWEYICQGFRLDLQSRILGCSGDDLIKLQGKLEYINEIETFFTSLLK